MFQHNLRLLPPGDKVEAMKSYLLFSFVVLFSFLSLIFTPLIQARIGVGVGTGKIQLDESLKPGTLYQLPSVTVVNTGDEGGEYILDVTYHEQQPAMRPDRAWFTFQPANFNLEPGEAKIVEVMLTLPIKTVPGDYFAYLEARPPATVNNPEGATIGVAAASKLYFTVAPASVLQGLYYRGLSLWNQYQPWPPIIIGAAGILVLLRLARNFISLNVSLKQKPSVTDKPDNEK